jgi:hypothetical protein
MTRNLIREQSRPEAGAGSTEVDFALVLSRMIDSVNANPEQLRNTVYELARLKLDEQSVDTGPEEKQQLARALEVAIRGVETHFGNLKLQSLEAPVGRSPRLSPPANQAMVQQTAAAVGQAARDAALDARPVPPFEQQRTIDWERGTVRRGSGFSAPWRYITVLAIVALVGFAIRQKIDPAALASKIALRIQLPAPTSKSAPAKSEQTPPAKSEETPAASTIPTAFGVYAVSDDKLYPLELLPGRAPNPRVAISAAISTSSKTVLPDAHIRFIVFRRDSASNALDRAEVRVIAKITQAMTFDPAGKPVISKAADAWVIRNISYSYQTGPLKGQPDMYEVLGEDPDKALGPGRYALILKGEAYDFSIGGDITDPRQCLESVVAANGSFYSECQKPR